MWGGFEMTDKYMDIYAQQGTKVVFTAAGGMDGQIRYAKERLMIGEIYTVRRTEIHSCHTNVYLEDFPEDSFNSCLFDKYVEEEPIPKDRPTIEQILRNPENYNEKTNTMEKPKESEFEDDPTDFQEAFEQCSRENAEAYKEIERLKPFEVWNKKAIKILNGLGKSYMILDVIGLVETLEGKQ